MLWDCESVRLRLSVKFIIIIKFFLTKTVPETNERVDNGERGEEEDEAVEDVLQEVASYQDVDSQELDRETQSSQRYLNQQNKYCLFPPHNFHTRRSVILQNNVGLKSKSFGNEKI